MFIECSMSCPIKNDQLLLREIALVLPLGSVAEFGRGIHAAYYNAHDSSLHDPGVGSADRIFERGNRRRTYINESLRQFTKNNLPVNACKDVCIGSRGSNNHVELHIGRYVITCHHVASLSQMPKESLYRKQNADLNLLMSQTELFPLEETTNVSQFKNPFNLLILHTESEESSSEVGMIEFVFPIGSKKLTSFSIEEIVNEQEVLARMEESDLEELRYRHDQFIKNQKIG